MNDFQATEALLSTEEEDTPTASPTVTSAAVPPSQGGGPIRRPVHPQAASTQRGSAPTPPSHNPPTPTVPVAPLNFSAAPSQQSSLTVGGQAAVLQQQVSVAATTPSAPSLPPYKPEDLHKWLYKDPQGEIQGERKREREREREIRLKLQLPRFYL